MPRATNWRFHAWNKSGSLYLDGTGAPNYYYTEEVPALTGSDSRIVGKHYEYDSVSTQQTKRYYAGGRLLATRTGTILRFVQPDHLGSSTTLTDANGVVVARERYSAFGERRRGESSQALITDQLYTDQRYNMLSGLYHYSDETSAGRFYDPVLARFVMADLVTLPGSQGLNRYSYVRNNPIVLTDPTGYWSEEELATILGSDWREAYFGEGAVFAGRDKLMNMLTSRNTNNMDALKLVWAQMAMAKTAHSNGIDMRDYDAIGTRVTGSVGAGGFGSLTFDFVLNVKSGEFSFFFGPGTGAMFGAGVEASVGTILIKNLASNDDYQGGVWGVGVSGAYILGGAGELFWSAPMSDNFSPFDKAHGGYAGGGFGMGIGVYASLGYSWEAFRVDAQGIRDWPFGPSPANIIDIARIIYHDYWQNPFRNPYSPYRRR